RTNSVLLNRDLVKLEGQFENARVLSELKLHSGGTPFKLYNLVKSADVPCLNFLPVIWPKTSEADSDIVIGHLQNFDSVQHILVCTIDTGCGFLRNLIGLSVRQRDRNEEKTETYTKFKLF